MTATLRLAKLMAARGLCSRREADRLIERGLVQVNGEPVNTLGTKVAADCTITLAPSAAREQDRRVTILLYKPIGYVSGSPEKGYAPAVSLVTAQNQAPGDRSGIRFQPGHREGLAPAGRLDIDSQGLLVLTQDGRVARRLIGPDSEIEKEYLVRYAGRLDHGGLTRLRHGLMLDGHRLKTARVEPLNADQLRMVLTEGRKRQIRRMCELVGLTVTGLKRVRIGRVRLAGLPPGQWRYLAASEEF